MFSPHAACLSCGRTGVRITRETEICALCWQNPITRAKFIEYSRRILPIAMDVCPHPPQSPEKVEWMAKRFEDGLSCFSPLDATFEGQKPGCVQPRTKAEVWALPKLRIRGVERDGKFFRARPFWLHRKRKLGAFVNADQATAVVRRFWNETLGVFAELGGRMGQYLPDELAEKLPMKDNKPAGSTIADKAAKRDRKKLTRCSKAEPLEEGGLLPPVESEDKYADQKAEPSKVDEKEKPEYPRLWKVAG